MNLPDLFAEAGAAWRRERTLLMPVAGLFYFLPSLALLLLLPQGPTPRGEAGQQAALDLLLAYAREHAGAILTANVVQLAGAAILFVLFLSPDRPALGQALRGAAGRMLSFVAAAMLTWAMLTVAALLIVPALYLIGRFFLVGAVIGGEGRGPVAALARSVELTRGRGWWCFAAAALPFLAGQLIVSVAGGFDGALVAAGADSPVLHLVFNGLAAAAATASWIVTILLKVVLYRRLTSGT